jgi:ppGpp synthetase/RelA/SpoT-type nucleotidyltranferase
MPLTVDDPAFRAEAKELYDKLLDPELEQARKMLVRALQDLIDTKFDPTERLRFYVQPGRVKQFGRLLKKAERKEYAKKIKKARDLFTQIPDVVGVRVTCNVTDDVYRVAKAIKDIERVTKKKKGARPSFRHRDDLGPKDYITEPKESGYRGHHVFVEVDVPSGGQQKPVVCEVQIHTLLQHAWGQLTHEDTYKPYADVPPIVAALSKRLATALAVMDEIAQDIRDELDKVVSEATAGANVQPKTSKPPPAAQAVAKTSEATQILTGQAMLAHVIYAGWDYALLQLPTGKTGILHWSRIPAPGSGYIDVSRYLQPGDTVNVRVVKHEPHPVRDRIELELDA